MCVCVCVWYRYKFTVNSFMTEIPTKYFFIILVLIFRIVVLIIFVTWSATFRPLYYPAFLGCPVFIWAKKCFNLGTIISWNSGLINSQTLKLISKVESFLCPDKYWTLEEGRRIQQPKRFVSTNNYIDEDNNPKNHNLSNTNQATSQ